MDDDILTLLTALTLATAGALIAWCRRQLGLHPLVTHILITVTAIAVLPSMLLFFYDARVVSRVLTGLGLLLLVSIGIFSLGYRGHFYKEIRFARASSWGVGWVQAIALLTVLGTVVGLARGNDLSLLASDALRMGLSALILWIAFSIFDEDLFRIVFVVCGLLVLTDLILGGYYGLNLIADGYERFAGTTVASLAWVAAWIIRGRWPLWGLMVGIFSVQLVVSLLSLTRGVWIVSALIVALCLTVVNSTRRWFILSSLGCTAILATLLISGGLWETVSDRMEEVVQTNEGGASSIKLRVHETKAAAAELQEMTIGEALGAGFGATYTFGGATRHHIHNTFASVYFRNGIAGFGIVASLYVAVIVSFARAMLNARRLNIIELWAALAGLGTIVVSMSYYGLIGEPVGTLAIGCLMRARMAQKQDWLTRRRIGVRSG